MIKACLHFRVIVCHQHTAWGWVSKLWYKLKHFSSDNQFHFGLPSGAEEQASGRWGTSDPGPVQPGGQLPVCQNSLLWRSKLGEREGHLLFCPTPSLSTLLCIHLIALAVKACWAANCPISYRQVVYESSVGRPSSYWLPLRIQELNDIKIFCEFCGWLGEAYPFNSPDKKSKRETVTMTTDTYQVCLQVDKVEMNA